jgi:acetolactate synthase-1/2/3 large subunit
VLISNGYASMGIGLPGAIAAKLVHPNRRVIAACGDGGFLMTAHELETAVRLQVGIVAMVFHDNAYGSIKRKQLARFGRTAGVDFGNPDFVQLAKAFNAQGFRPSNASELLSLLESSLESPGPSVIDVPVDYS